MPASSAGSTTTRDGTGHIRYGYKQAVKDAPQRSYGDGMPRSKATGMDGEYPPERKKLLEFSCKSCILVNKESARKAEILIGKAEKSYSCRTDAGSTVQHVTEKER